MGFGSACVWRESALILDGVFWWGGLAFVDGVLSVVMGWDGWGGRGVIGDS